jgi:diguanylate cyclase (GGDEF)-like protein
MGSARFSHLFRPSPEFTERKFTEHLAYSKLMFWAMAPYLACMWAWDLTLDPVGAPDVLWHRLALGALAAACGATIGTPRLPVPTRVRLISVCVTLSIAVYYLICARLNQGFTFGVGAFVFVQMCGFLLWPGFPFGWVVLLHVIGAAVPQLLAVLLANPGFPHPQYAVLVWPTTVLALAAHYMIHSDYLTKEALRDRLVEMATRDPLTGVLNRRTFMTEALDRIAQCAGRWPGISVLFIDADHFKQINDRHGHAVGDAVLVQLGEVIRRQLRRGDLCCRWGGEEFVVLLCEPDETHGVLVAQRILRAIRQASLPVEGGPPVTFTASIGLARAEAAALRLEVLIDKADQAMYAAKTLGRNRVAVAAA